MYKRFFAFGCSFTNFYWPTWADVIGSVFSTGDYHNYGLCATGNEFIFHRLTEVNARYKIGPDDLVIIQWTNFAREDRYLAGAWKTSGNIFTQKVYPPEWVAKWFDLRGALLKTSSCIAGATHLLQTTGCEFHYHSMVPMRQINQQDTVFAGAEYEDIFAVYRSYYDLINISMVEHLYGSSPINPRPARIKFKEEHKESYVDHHPTPKQHLQFAKDIILPLLTQPVDISPETIRWINTWDDKIFNSIPYFKCSVDGWSFDYRYQKHHGHLC